MKDQLIALGQIVALGVGTLAGVFLAKKVMKGRKR
jgi:uncharacterized protein YneF (UPF0154 family)